VRQCVICGYSKIYFFNRINIYRYFLCKNCNTLQLKNNNIISSFSNNYKYQVNKVTRSRLISNSKTILNFIIKHTKARNSLLDIGSGYGYFLNKAKKVFKTTLGLEPSLNLYKYSKEKFNLNVKNQSFENFYRAQNNSKYDAITLIHVIEHIKNPNKFIEDALSLLKVDGMLYIETPNLDSLKKISILLNRSLTHTTNILSTF